MALSGRIALPVALGLLASCARGQPVDPVILALGDQEVRRSDFEQYVANLEAREDGTLQPGVLDALLHAYLERRVLVLEARSRGLLGPASTSEEEQAAVQELLAQEVGSRIQVAEEEVEKYHVEHRAELALPERVTLHQILVGTPNEARNVLRRLQKDPKSFEALAQTLSHGPEASAGGLMGIFSRGQLPAELETAAFALRPGETSPAIQTALGHHILRADAFEAAREPTLEECRGRIRARLAAQKAERSEREFVAGLMARAKVNHEAAKARFPRP